MIKRQNATKNEFMKIILEHLVEIDEAVSSEERIRRIFELFEDSITYINLYNDDEFRQVIVKKLYEFAKESPEYMYEWICIRQQLKVDNE